MMTATLDPADAFTLVLFEDDTDWTIDPTAFADDSALPSLEDQAFELGRTIGLTGGDALWLEIVRDRMPALLGNGTLRDPAYYHGERGFYAGLFAGQSAWSRQLGYDLGLDGEDAVPPLSTALKPNSFAGGHADGVADCLDRQAIMAASSPADDWHDAEIAECGMGSRLIPVAY